MINDCRSNVGGVLDDFPPSLAAVLPIDLVGGKYELRFTELSELLAGAQPDRTTPLCALLHRGNVLGSGLVVGEVGGVLADLGWVWCGCSGAAGYSGLGADGDAR